LGESVTYSGEKGGRNSEEWCRTSVLTHPPSTEKKGRKTLKKDRQVSDWTTQESRGRGGERQAAPSAKESEKSKKKCNEERLPAEIGSETRVQAGAEKNTGAGMSFMRTFDKNKRGS